MDPKVLADALVEAGIGSPYGLKLSRWYSIPDDSFGASGVLAEKFITDWRVAGKCLESMEPVEISLMVLNAGSSEVMRSPRAIIEAWYKATEQRERHGLGTYDDGMVKLGYRSGQATEQGESDE